MAKRFGGRFSPQQTRLDGSDPRPPARPHPGEMRHPLESRTRWVTIMAIPFLISAFWQDPTGLATHLIAFGTIASGMWMTREGLQAEAAYDARRVARRPAIPRKLFGGILTGLGLAIGAYVPGAEIGAGIIGVAGSLLHWLAFGTEAVEGIRGADEETLVADGGDGVHGTIKGADAELFKLRSGFDDDEIALLAGAEDLAVTRDGAAEEFRAALRAFEALFVDDLAGLLLHAAEDAAIAEEVHVLADDER